MLIEQIREEIKKAMFAKDTVKLNVFRGIVTACTNELVATGKKPQDMLSDEDVVLVITRLAKQRKDSIDQYTKANRMELVATEEAELAVLQSYLPKLMSIDEIQIVALAKKTELGISDATKKGMLMSTIMKELKGKADGGDVKQVVDSLFN